MVEEQSGEKRVKLYLFFSQAACEKYAEMSCKFSGFYQISIFWTFANTINIIKIAEIPAKLKIPRDFHENLDENRREKREKKE